MIPLPAAIIDMAEKYGVNVARNQECDRNEGWSAGSDIFLGEFDDPSIEMVAFFHELGHALSTERVVKRGTYLMEMSKEGLAWELGMEIAFENGHQWEWDSPEMKYARRCLLSYIDSDATKLDLEEAKGG